MLGARNGGARSSFCSTSNAAGVIVTAGGNSECKNAKTLRCFWPLEYEAARIARMEVR